MSNETEFLKNWIRNNCRNAARKLRGLEQLVSAGHQVRSLPYSSTQLVVDGRIYGFEVLECPGVLKNWNQFAQPINP